jgi:hypothetical protein
MIGEDRDSNFFLAVSIILFSNLLNKILDTAFSTLEVR